MKNFRQLKHYKFVKSFSLYLLNQYFPKLNKLFINLKNIWYKGSKKFCPCCGGNFRKFMLYDGTVFRYSAQCPGCKSLERHRLLFLYLKYRTNFFREKVKVLHIAPMKILHTIFKNKSNLNYICINLNPSKDTIKMDVSNLLFKDNSFDVILCSHVLEHVHDDNLAMRELFRVLKPNGWAIIQIPIDLNRKKTFEDPSIVLPEERKRLFGEKNHLRIYGLDFKNRLEKTGFDVQVKGLTSELEDNIVKKNGLEKNEKLYICKKKS